MVRVSFLIITFHQFIHVGRQLLFAFIINKDGMISNIKIAQSADPLLNNEALRVVRLMPTWKPGLENNKPCRTMFAIPIEFKL